MLYSMHNYARIHFHLSLWPSALQIILATFSFTRSTAGHQLFKVAYFKVRLWTGNSLFGIRHMHTPASGTHAHRHACTQSHTHTRMHSHTHALTHTCTHTRIHARTHTHTCTCTHTHTHTHALTHTSTHTCTHMPNKTICLHHFPYPRDKGHCWYEIWEGSINGQC